MIADALQDLKNSALKGRPLNFVEIAEDYGLNPKLLERKFHESFPNGVVALESESEMLKRKIETRVSELCSYYGVPASKTKVMTIRGVTYTMICSLSGAKRYKYAGVSHKDGRSYKIAA